MKISDSLVLIGFITIVIVLYFGITQNIADMTNLRKKCKDNNMILIKPFREKPYCAKGIR